MGRIEGKVALISGGVVAALNPNDGNSIPPWLVIVLAVAIVGVAVVSFLRRKR